MVITDDIHRVTGFAPTHIMAADEKPKCIRIQDLFVDFGRVNPEKLENTAKLIVTLLKEYVDE